MIFAYTPHTGIEVEQDETIIIRPMPAHADMPENDCGRPNKEAFAHEKKPEPTNANTDPHEYGSTEDEEEERDLQPYEVGILMRLGSDGIPVWPEEVSTRVRPGSWAVSGWAECDRSSFTKMTLSYSGTRLISLPPLLETSGGLGCEVEGAVTGVRKVKIKDGPRQM